MNLPELPSPPAAWSDVLACCLYSPDQLRAYAEEAVKQEREQTEKLRYALQELLADSQHMRHESCDDGGYCPVRDAREALAAFDATRTAVPAKDDRRLRCASL